MNKIIGIISGLIMILLFVNISTAQTDEVKLKELYKQYFLLECNIEKGMNNYSDITEYNGDMLKIIDCAVKIIKLSPGSVEAYQVMLDFTESFEAVNGVIGRKYQELKAKYSENLNDSDTDIAEKLFFIKLTFAYPGTFEPADENPEKFQKYTDSLLKIKNEYKNKDYQALALVILFDKKSNEDYCREFLKRFPGHPAVPLVKLYIVSGYYAGNNYKKCIDELNILLKQHADMVIPEGWKFEICCYELLAACYAYLHDWENAQKYLSLIEKNAPEDPQIQTVKNIIEAAKKFPDERVPVDKPE